MSNAKRSDISNIAIGWKNEFLRLGGKIRFKKIEGSNIKKLSSQVEINFNRSIIFSSFFNSLQRN